MCSWQLYATYLVYQSRLTRSISRHLPGRVSTGKEPQRVSISVGDGRHLTNPIRLLGAIGMQSLVARGLGVLRLCSRRHSYSPSHHHRSHKAIYISSPMLGRNSLLSHQTGDPQLSFPVGSHQTSPAAAAGEVRGGGNKDIPVLLHLQSTATAKT